MFGKAISFGGMLLLAGALVLVTPGSGRAQHHGGGRGGGFHGGSAHVGGIHSGNFHSSSFHGYYNHGYYNHGYHRFNGLGYYPYYYPKYGYYRPYSYSTPYSYYPSFDLGYDSAPDSGYQSAAVSRDIALAQADTTANVTVRLPANSQLWFDSSITNSTGPVREFQSPSLDPGRYTYEVRARWTENGRDITQTQTVTVSPGAHVTADFPIRSGTD
jgi:uncharacterized protein (TIGR03000 family)